jgi:CHAD domain-containing protein
MRDVKERKGGDAASHDGRGGPLEILLEAFDARWKKYRKELRRCGKECSEESVHDLRVATRRLVGWIDIVQLTMPDKRLQKVRQVLKKQFDRLSPLRDIQVQILSINGMISRYPQLEPFLTILLLREQRLLKSIARVVAGAETRTMSGVFTSVRRTIRSRLALPAVRHALLTALQGAAASAFTRTVDSLKKTRPDDTTSIHHLRVTFKKFRYMLEMLAPLLGVTKEQVKAMNAYQDRMGDVQDIEVLVSNVNAFALRRRRVRTRSLLPVHQELARQRAARIEAFMRSADDLLTFWEETPFAEDDTHEHGRVMTSSPKPKE